MAIPKVRKKKTVRTPRAAGKTFMGDEPVWGNKPATAIDIAKANNWYNYFSEKRICVTYLTDHLKDKKQIALINAADSLFISSSLCFLARMKDNGCVFSTETQKFFDEKLEEALELGRKAKKSKPRAKNSNKDDDLKKIMSKWKRDDEQASIVGTYDIIFDSICEGQLDKPSLEIYEMLGKINAKPIHAKALIDRYQQTLDEIIEVRTKDGDPDLKENYSCYSTKTLGVMQKWLEALIKDCTTFSIAQKRRVVRKKKIKSVADQVKKVKYQKEATDLKLVGEVPDKVVGAQEIWVYNTKNRELAFYKSTAPGGFSFKGSSLVGWDEKNSKKKKLRKAEDTLRALMDGGKRVPIKVFNELTTKPSEPNGRFNETSLIVRTFN